jgi:hypothetical protein
MRSDEAGQPRKLFRIKRDTTLQAMTDFEASRGSSK